jgi:hypothetical protein
VSNTPETDPTKPDLTLVDTRWMIEELMRRNDSIVIVSEYRTTGQDRKTIFEYGGGLNAALGLVYRAQRWLDAECDDDEPQ